MVEGRDDLECECECEWDFECECECDGDFIDVVATADMLTLVARPDERGEEVVVWWQVIKMVKRDAKVVFVVIKSMWWC